MTHAPGAEEPSPRRRGPAGAPARRVEARVEFLDAAVRSQESLADRLTSAMESARQAQGQLADLHVGRVQRRLRGIALRAKRRVDQQLGRSEPVQPVETHSRVPGAEHALSDNRYPQWIAVYHTLDADARAALTSDVEALKDPPLISIVFPVYNAPEEYLRQAIESVRAQIYANWEAVHLRRLFDGATRRQGARRVRRTRRADPRRSPYRERHISASSNSAIALATANGSA